MTFDPTKPFLRSDALTAGLTDEELHGSRYRKLLWGVYVAAETPDSPLLLPTAALLVHPPGAAVTHCSAARVLGAPVPKDPRVHVTVADKGHRRGRQGVRCHVAALVQADLMDRWGLRMSTPHRMFVELASELPLVELVVVGDWLVRHGHVSCESLVAYCHASHAKNAKLAARAATYVRERVDSPMETRVRMLIVLAGLPEPEVNVTIRDEHGTVLLRFDLCYPSVRLAVEYDGRVHVETARQQDLDAERRDLVPDGWRLLTVTSKGIYREPAQTVDRVWKALARRNWPGLKPPIDDWRPHFS